MPFCYLKYLAFGLLLLALLTGQAHAMERSPLPVPRPYVLRMPELRWHSQPKGEAWTRATMEAVQTHGARLLNTVPRDIDAWCPGYAQADKSDRAAFWAGLLSALSYHESTWRADAVGGGGQWYGLTQIAPPTARWRRCRAQTGEALKNGAANLSCAVRIMSVTVPRDQVVAAGMKGVAADWGPFHSDTKRADMRRWISKQPFCKARMTRSPFPILRPQAMLREAVLPPARPSTRP
ncbi:transglycosylase SLT domain-containing protein [Celeribacter sp.]|uniref:transglycosylase SLT domain-containing protein n=1 Tax=Celeribacter sp. TaxID=1890673 RepID=UPI003A8DBAA4